MFPNPAWPYLRLLDDDQRIIGMDEVIFTSSGDSYADKVKAIFGSSLIDYRRLNEGSGTSAFDSSPKAHAAGTISGATWTPGAGFDGGPALLYDGVNDYTDIFSAALNSDFNMASVQVATFLLWYRMSNVGVWTDAAANRSAVRFSADANNLIQLGRDTVNDKLSLFYIAGGTTKNPRFTVASSDTNWHCMALTIDKNALPTGEVKAYHDGVQQGATLTGLGTWVGALSSTQTVIGAANNSGSQSWSGYVREFALGNTALTQAQIAQLAVR